MDQEQLVKIFKALANEGRLKILTTIWNSEMQCACQPGTAVQDGEQCCDSTGPQEQMTCCVDDIVCQFDMAQSTISQHLKELHNAGLLERHKKAQWVYYTINRKVLDQVASVLQQFSTDLVAEEQS